MTIKEAVKLLKKAIREQEKKRHSREDCNDFRGAELAEFHENGLQEALDILQGKKEKPKAPRAPVRPQPKPKKKDLAEDHIWTTRDQKRIPIVEMGDSHLINTINFLRRGASKRVQSFVVASNPFQGEMAQDSFDDAQDAALEDPDGAEEGVLETSPQYQHLVAEAQRRGLRL